MGVRRIVPDSRSRFGDFKRREERREKRAHIHPTPHADPLASETARCQQRLTLTPHSQQRPLQTGKVVILLSGRYAGKKAVIVKNYDDGHGSRTYGHALVCGLSKEPRRVTKKQSSLKQARRSSLKTFTKVVNYQHMMPTRYTLDADLKNVITSDSLENSTKRTEANKEAKAILEEKFKSGKNRWFFTKLRF